MDVEGETYVRNHRQRCTMRMLTYKRPLIVIVAK